MGAVILHQASVLLVERGREPLKGYWSLPGGVLETGETGVEGVRREVLEETGLTVDVGPLIEVYERIILDQHGRVEYHYVLLDYLCTAQGGDLIAADDASRSEWFPADALPAVHLTEGTLPVILKAFSLISTGS